MRRALTTLAAMAAAAAVAAAITLPAGAQSSGGGQDPALARFVACLSAHGVDVPAGLDGVAFKQWLGQRQDDATVSAAQAACDTARPARGDDRGFAQLYSCLTSHGVTVENSPAAVKRKVVELNGTDAGRATLAACKVSVDKPSGDDAGPGKPAQDCGAAAKPAQPADDQKPELTGS